MLRVNIYDSNGPTSGPGRPLNESGKSIFHIVRKGDGKEALIDLSPYNIYVSNDFISLELLKVYGDIESGWVLAASAFEQYGSYRRYVSQDGWEKIDSRNLAYSLETSVSVSENKAKRFEKRRSKREAKEQYASGFVIFGGRMLSGVQVMNLTSKLTTVTDDNGRFRIAYQKDDIISFSKEGFQTKHLTLFKVSQLNVRMRPKDIE